MTDLELINKVLNEHFEDNIVITDDDGEEMECLIEGTVPYNDDIYIIVSPIDNEEEGYCFKAVVENNEVLFDSDISQEVLDTIFDMFYSYEEEEDK